MYELTKQKPTRYYILIGIVIIIFISSVLKIAFDKPARTLNDDLVSAANEINSHAPIIIDSTTRLDGVLALPGNVFQYSYTLTTAELSQIDTNQLRLSWKQYISEMAKSNPKTALFRENGIVIQAKYQDKKGRYITTLTAYPNEY